MLIKGSKRKSTPNKTRNLRLTIFLPVAPVIRSVNRSINSLQTPGRIHNPDCGKPQKSPFSRMNGSEHGYSAGTLTRSKAQGPANAITINTRLTKRHTRLFSFNHDILASFLPRFQVFLFSNSRQGLINHKSERLNQARSLYFANLHKPKRDTYIIHYNEILNTHFVQRIKKALSISGKRYGYILIFLPHHRPELVSVYLIFTML